MTNIPVTRAKLRKHVVERNPALKPRYAFLVVFLIKGNHVHCRLRSVPPTGGDAVLLGDFIVGRAAEFRALHAAMDGVCFRGYLDVDTIERAGDRASAE